MTLIAIAVHSMRLGFRPVRGRRTFYLTLTLFGRTLWVQRWDTGRAPRNRLRSRDGLMGWTAGVR